MDATHAARVDAIARQLHRVAKFLDGVHNPKAYRLRVLARLPHLRQLDQMAVSTQERDEVMGMGLRGRARQRHRRPPAPPA